VVWRCSWAVHLCNLDRKRNAQLRRATCSCKQHARAELYILEAGKVNNSVVKEKRLARKEFSQNFS
jgi:hypothetical protein